MWGKLIGKAWSWLGPRLIDEVIKELEKRGAPTTGTQARALALEAAAAHAARQQ